MCLLRRGGFAFCERTDPAHSIDKRVYLVEKNNIEWLAKVEQLVELRHLYSASAAGPSPIAASKNLNIPSATPDRHKVGAKRAIGARDLLPRCNN